MGYWYSELIPPAILFDNSGLTVDQYNHQLDQITHGIRRPHDYPYTLAEKLGLPRTQSYLDFRESKIDENGLEINAPYVLFNEDGSCRVELHLRNDLSPIKGYGIIDHEEISVDQVISIGIPYEYRTCQVKEIVSKKPSKAPDNNTHGYYGRLGLKTQYFKYKIKGQEIKKVTKTEYFDSQVELFKKWPQFKAENVFDFSCIKGSFLESNICTEKFRWLMSDGRYSLDPITFDKIPEGGNVRQLGVGYTDLVLTAEVIKHGELDLLGHNSRDPQGEILLQNFLDRHSDSSSRVSLAILDAHTSIYAKIRGLNHLELIHLRIDPKMT